MSLRLGPLLVCICVGLFRALWLSLQLSSLDAFEIGYLLLADLPVVGALGILAFAEAVFPRAWKLLPAFLAIALLALYLVDVFTVFALNSRLQLSDIRRFAGEWWLAGSFVSASSLAVLGAAVGCFFITLRVPMRYARFLPGTALLCPLVPFMLSDQAIPTHLEKYAGSVLFLPKELWGARKHPVPQYRAGDIAAYRREFDALFDAPIARTGRDIVLVAVESLSAVDSQRTAGIEDNLPRFDALSREGMLFRNFFANFEASEGGLVSLLSGAPPLHFPTASTDTFAEYAMQRSVTETLRRSGYTCQFLTTVPLRFISMDTYVRSPRIGFNWAGGQREVERFKEAPRFAFESPSDHVLYEELLARLDARPRDRRAPVFMTAVTASSHPPYVDPRGQSHTAQNVWAYVQDELWWLYEELTRRGFFENGLLIITGDHRKMSPVRQMERETFGESAKARIPLVILGTGVPKGTVDDRLFQQSDLLRMLDRALQPGVELSPYVLWVERYVFVFGLASNASTLQVFDGSNRSRVGFRLNLRGAEIDWLTQPPDVLMVERAIHRQRAIQQATRTATVSSTALNYGRDMEPSDAARGVLVGFSTDVNLSRDPDDASGALKLLTTDSYDLNRVLPVVGGGDAPYTLTVRSFLRIPTDGEYWFSLFADDQSCLAIDKQMVLGCQRGLNEGLALLTAGVHRLDLRFVAVDRTQQLQLKWMPPGAKTFAPLPWESLILPETRH